MKKKLALAGLLLLFSLSLTACQATPKLINPDVRGIVEGLSSSTANSEITGFILIVGNPEEGLAYDQAFLAISKDTKIYRQLENGITKANFNELSYGMTVDAWITGPVAESYPIQAEAETVLILQ